MGGWGGFIHPSCNSCLCQTEQHGRKGVRILSWRCAISGWGHGADAHIPAVTAVPASRSSMAGKMYEFCPRDVLYRGHGADSHIPAVTAVPASRSSMAREMWECVLEMCYIWLGAWGGFIHPSRNRCPCQPEQHGRKDVRILS